MDEAGAYFAPASSLFPVFTACGTSDASVKMETVIDMRFSRLRQSIETLPRHIYIYLKCLLSLAALMLLCSLLLGLASGRNLALQHLSLLLCETPAGVLLLGVIGLALLLDSA